MKSFYLLLAALACAGVTAVRAGSPGDEVVVVYNSRMPESKAVAEYYAKRRQVPASQVFGFGLPTNELFSRAEFRDGLQRPLANALQTKKLWRIGLQKFPATTNQAARSEYAVIQSKVRYAVLCYGVPLKITPQAELKEPATEHMRPEMRRDEAAVDSELALLPEIEQDLPLAGPLRNPLYALTNAAMFHPTNGVLMVARLDGPSAAIARGLVDKALQAEADGLWGRAYFDLRNITDPGYRIGDDWIRNASEMSRRLGFETVVDESPGTFPGDFPMSQIAFYAGWYAQDACGPFAQPTVEFMPGAFAYHLHSYSADSLRTTNRCWVGPLLAKGATATMGCVFEPYLTGTPDIAVFTSRLIFFGFTFGEAAYASQGTLSWQTTVVGDPLYRPFGKTPEQLHDELRQRQSKLIEWSWLRLVNLNPANGRSADDCIALLEQIETTKQSAVLTEKLGDLYAAQGKPSSAVHAYEQALKLGPSPQQHIRLLLGLGERLAGLNREGDAYAEYQTLVQEFPAYPGKPALYRKLLLLANKLGKTADAEKYEAILGLAAQHPKLEAGQTSASEKQTPANRH